jgi:hypothetical protein
MLAAAMGCEAGPPAFGEPAAGLSASGEATTAEPVVADDPRRGEGAVEEQVPPLEPAADGGVSTSLEDGSAASRPSSPPSTAASRMDYRAVEPAGPRLDPEEWGTERFPYPDAVRAIYLNAWAAGSTTRVEALLELARRTEINSFVIDIKDATGYVSHRSQLPLAEEIGATGEIRIRDLPGLLARLEEEGIYPIARIVIVKDPLLIAARPELAVQDTAGGVWVDSKEIIWLNPFQREVWDYHLDLAKEVASMGFPEIQWDYVRFPDAPRSDLDRAVFGGADGRTKAQGIRSFLNHARAELAGMEVLSTADVFGMTTSASRDVGIGQVWEAFIDVVDAALPMVYPSHYGQGSFGLESPNAYPYETVYRAMRDAHQRSAVVEGAGVARPYLQDFTLGQPRYEAPEVRAQIEATYDAGIEEWVMWNPGSRYTEGAYAPESGWPLDAEPLIRVAGGIYPASRRHVVIDSVRAAESLAESRAQAITDSLNAATMDSAGVEPSSPFEPDVPGGEPEPATLDLGGSEVFDIVPGAVVDPVPGPLPDSVPVP